MKISRYQEGSAILLSLVIILFFGAIGIGFNFILRQVLYIDKKQEITFKTRQKLYKEADIIMNKLLENDTSIADSEADPIWEYLADKSGNEIGTELTDVSSMINPNWIRKELIEGSSLSSILSEGAAMDDVQQYRHDNGFSIDIKEFYKNYFTQDALENVLSPYSYANINTADEFSLMKLYEIRKKSNQRAETFRTKVQKLRMDKKIIKPSELRDVLFPDYDDLFPFISALPAFNIHFIAPDTLKGILNYKYGEKPLPHPETSYQRIISLRANTEITPKQLSEIISEDDINHPVYQYLGTKTWFWEIVLTLDKTSLRIICAVYPPEESISLIDDSIESLYPEIEKYSINIIESRLIRN